jgi:hypothetical protein
MGKVVPLINFNLWLLQALPWSCDMFMSNMQFGWKIKIRRGKFEGKPIMPMRTLTLVKLWEHVATLI